jgi:uncharacterized protein
MLPGERAAAEEGAGQDMRRRALAGSAACSGLIVLIVLWAPGPARGASFDCNARGLSPAALAICRDAQLSRADELLARRLLGLARRLNFGQYLGLRHWHSGWMQSRGGCGTDRACLAASYRAQNRFIDRLQQCLDNGLQRRACLRNTLNVERATTVRR